MVACDVADHGCVGGWIQNAWKYLETKGVGEESCYPYTSGTTGKSGICEREKCNKYYKCKEGT